MIEGFSFGLNWSILFAVVVAFMGSVLMAARRLRVRHHKVTLRALEREALKIWRADRPKAALCASCAAPITPEMAQRWCAGGRDADME